MSQSQLAARRDLVSYGDRQREAGAVTHRTAHSRSPRSRSAKWGIEDNTAWYGQEKKKLGVNTVVCIRFSISVSHTPGEAMTAFENKT